MKFTVALLILSSIFLTSCGAFDTEYIPANIQGTPQIEYMKDPRGNCFAYVGSKTAQAYVVYSISHVSCKDAGL